MRTKSSKKIISTTIVAAIIVLSAMVALAMPVDNQNALTESAPKPMGLESYGAIPCSDVCPAPDDDIYTISVPLGTCGADVDITVRDGFLVSDRYEVWVDGVYIGTTPTEICGVDGGTDYSQGTFSVLLTPGDHTLQFKNTCEPCFTGDPPCYDGWLSSGFYYMVEMEIIPDTTPPVAECLETVNPHGKNVPPAGSTTPPGPKGGQNEDGFYELIATDNCDPNPEIFVVDTGSSAVFGPFVSGTKIKYTEAPGATPEQKTIGSSKGNAGAIDCHIIGNGDATLKAVDSAGNVGWASCLVPPPPK